MYCVKCGVELADSEKKCPLCGTPVFHPDIPRNLSDPPFPPDRRIRPEDVNRSGILFVLTVAALLPALLCLLCDWRINGTLVWSGYAAGAIGLLYIVILLPMWFRHPNPVIFVPVDFVAVGLYLLYINMIRNIREPELESHFYRVLHTLGLPVKVESNQRWT